MAQLVLNSCLDRILPSDLSGGVQMKGSVAYQAWLNRGRTMVTLNVVGFLVSVFFWISLFLPMPEAAGEQRGPLQGANEKRVYIGLTEDFYRALQSENDSGNRVYGDRKSDEYLRQIAVSAKFMVETNLRLLEMQERMIELLEKAQPKGRPER